MYNLVFFLIIFIKIVLSSLSRNQYSLYHDRHYQSQSIIHKNRIFKGIDIFKSSESSPTIESITITGWYLIRCNQNKYYSIYSLYENDEQILFLRYHFDFGLKNQVEQVLYDQKSKQIFNELGPNVWYFFKTDLKYSSSANEVTLDTVMHYQDNLFKLVFPQIKYPRSKPFQKNDINIQIGNFLGQSGCEQSCAFTKSIYIYWDFILDDNNINKFYENVVTYDMNLVWHLDFFYSNKNQGVVFNIADSMNQYTLEQNQSTNPLRIQPRNIFKTDYINPLEFGGFMLTFHVRIPQSFSSLRLLTIKNKRDTIYIDLKDSNKVSLNNQQIINVPLSSYIQITLIVKQLLKNQAFLIVQGFENDYKEISFITFMNAYLQFGDPSNTEVIELNNIRYYKGIFLIKDENNCFIQSSRNYINSCVMCKSQFLINYQGSINCVPQTPPYTSTNIQSVKDWYPTRLDNCPHGMLHDPIKNDCVCMHQYYKKDNECLVCPRYCKGCTDSSTCIEQDENRINGLCPFGYFDDGYLCINNKLSINSKQNIVKQFNNPSLGPNCAQDKNAIDYTLDNSYLKLTGKESFFFSFSYVIQDPKKINTSFAYLRDGSSELFTFVYNRDVSINPSVDLLILGEKKFNFIVYENQAIWFAIWSDFKKAIIIVYGFSMLEYKEIDVNFKFQIKNPLLCIGPCKSYYSAEYACGNFSQRPLIFIYNMTLPVKDIDSILDLLSIQSTTIASYSVGLYDNTNNGGLNDLNNPNQQNKLQFQGTNYIFNQMKGIQFTEQTSSVIKNINLNSYWLSFACSLFPEKLTYQTSIFSYQINGSFIEYMIVPNDRQRAFIRICYLNECKDTKYSMIYLNDYNTLFIITKLKTPFSGGIHFIEFEVVCNYQKEKLQYLSVSFSGSIPPTDLYIGQQNNPTQDYSIYLNNIQLLQGNGNFYFDYTNDNKCFIQTNPDQMNCLLPKQGYVKYKDQIISEEECYKLNQPNRSMFIIHKSTKSCIDSSQFLPYCKKAEIINDQMICQECLFENTELNNNCKCQDGYFQNKVTYQCELCDSKCKTCSESANNCLTCHYFDQLSPNCDCADLHQFRNQQNKCEECSPSCETCEFNKDICKTCSSQKRNFPPSCECNQEFYREKNFICEDLVCDNQCQTCKYEASNCQRCQPGRIDPPFCVCDINHYQDSDYSCTPCPPQQFYDQQTNQCKPCQKPCLSCVNDQYTCLSCSSNQFILKQQKCFCQSGLALVYLSDSKYACLEEMEVSLKVTLKNQHYQLELEFDYEMRQIDFYDNQIQQILNVHLSEIPKEYYDITDPVVKKNTLYLRLNVYQSFQLQRGALIFLQNTPFISQDEKFVLSEKYKTKLNEFDIGPFIFTKDILNQQEISETVDLLKNENKDLLNFIQSTQILFYFLNTAQPTLLFLLLKAQLPPNLYSFYQIFGILIFPDVVNYQTTDYKNEFTFLGHQLENYEVQLTQDPIYKKLGFSNSFLVNVQIIVLKYACMIFIIGILQFIIYQFSQSPQKKQKLLQVQCILLQKINGENDTNLLILTISILVQFTDTDEDLWSVRYGVYLSICFFILFIVSFSYNFIEINNQQNRNEYQYSHQFTERINNNQSFFSRNYFLIQLFKKYFVVLTLFLFKELPYYACTINGTVFLLSSIQTYLLKPYKQDLSRIIKILGELILSTSWYMHIFLIMIEGDLYRQTILNEDDINQYINLGNAVIVLLLIFNVIFLIQYLIIAYVFMKSKLIQHKAKKINESITQMYTIIYQQKQTLKKKTF